jgi:hypothetical protein
LFASFCQQLFDVTEKRKINMYNRKTKIRQKKEKEIISFQDEQKKRKFRFHTYKNDFLSVCPNRDRRRTYIH